jgi:hypothetical protein
MYCGNGQLLEDKSCGEATCTFSLPSLSSATSLPLLEAPQTKEKKTVHDAK